MQTESIEFINERLKDNFGIDTLTGLPIWRVVWTTDQLEKRLSKITETGIELLHPKVIEMKKYIPSLQNRYVLEQLVVVPEFQQKEILTAVSYEPMFFFEDKNNNPQPVFYRICEFIIYSILFAKGETGTLAKYKDDPDEERQKELDKMLELFFGNETAVTDALQVREGIVVPSKFFGESDTTKGSH